MPEAEQRPDLAALETELLRLRTGEAELRREREAVRLEAAATDALAARVEDAERRAAEAERDSADAVARAQAAKVALDEIHRSRSWRLAIAVREVAARGRRVRRACGLGR